MAGHDKEIQKRSEIIQQYFNKINITRIKDLVAPTDKNQDATYAYGSYRTSIENLTIVDQGRLQRYREYEQMCYVPELSGGLELYGDDSSLYNTEDRVIEIQSDDQDIEDSLHDLWFKSLDMNSMLWHIVYNTCKYGDAFYEIIPDNYKNPKKIKYIRFVPPQFVVRIERDGNLIEFIVRVTPDSRTPTSATFYSAAEAEEFHLKPWQMVHFKLDDKEFEPYGKSVLEYGRLTFKQMKLIEDAMLIYRISRAPERRVFGIPVGNLPYREAMKRVEDIKTRYRKTPWVDPTTGEIAYNANPLSINDDFFLPRRPDGSGITIDYLPGGQQLGEIDDVRYFKEKILRTMRIPYAYMTGELTGDVARTSLSAMDIRFAKTIERIQKQIIKGLEKLAIVELAFKRFTIEDMHGFQLLLTPPSKIYEIQELETFTNKLNTIQTAMALADEQGNLFLPKEWLYKNILKFTSQEISDIKLMQQREQAEKAEATAAAEAGAAGEFGGGMAPGGGLAGAGMAPGGEGAPEAGLEMGAEAGLEAGAEAGPPPEETPAEAGGAAELAAAQIMKIAGEDFLVENEEDIKQLIKFVKEYRETEKITKDKPIQKIRKKMYENNFDNLFLHGELKGLIRRRNNNHKKGMLKD